MRYLEDLRVCASVRLQVVMRNSSKTKPSGGDLRERERALRFEVDPRAMVVLHESQTMECREEKKSSGRYIGLAEILYPIFVRSKIGIRPTGT